MSKKKKHVCVNKQRELALRHDQTLAVRTVKAARVILEAGVYMGDDYEDAKHVTRAAAVVCGRALKSLED